MDRRVEGRARAHRGELVHGGDLDEVEGERHGDEEQVEEEEVALLGVEVVEAEHREQQRPVDLEGAAGAGAVVEEAVAGEAGGGGDGRGRGGGGDGGGGTSTTTYSR